MVMKRSSYRERDYTFGQITLTVRTRLGLTQAELADQLGVRRRAVIDWEGGRSWELDLLSAWIIQERCRVVSVLGQGGKGSCRQPVRANAADRRVCGQSSSA
jgi:hypothetical protein